MKKLISSVLAVTILLALPGMALAKTNKADKPLSGKVTAVDTTKNTITISTGKKGESKTFNAAGAKITVDGVSATLASITVKMHAKITVGSDPGTATAIDASSHKKGGKNKGNPTPPAS